MDLARRKRKQRPAEHSEQTAVPGNRRSSSAKERSKIRGSHHGKRWNAPRRGAPLRLWPRSTDRSPRRRMLTLGFKDPEVVTDKVPFLL